MYNLILPMHSYQSDNCTHNQILASYSDKSIPKSSQFKLSRIQSDLAMTLIHNLLYGLELNSKADLSLFTQLAQNTGLENVHSF